MGNSKLHAARSAKNDEFYTLPSDIDAELRHYDFRGKRVYSPCDDYRWSEFTRYFVDHFAELGLVSYCCTNYDIGEGTYKMVYDGRDMRVTKMESDGDFMSQECMEIAAASDIIVTNPPFSLFRQYVPMLLESDIKFILIGNQNAVTYKDMYPYFMDNRMWWGHNCVRWFSVDDPGTRPWKSIDGCIAVEGARSRWYTNVEHENRHVPIQLTEMYSPDVYPTYDNSPAIDVSSTSAIPSDYSGTMGVPITFLDRYCPEQFRIVGFRKGDDGKDLAVNGKTPFFRILIEPIL